MEKRSDKKSLRRYYTAELNQLTKAEVEAKSRLIYGQALSLPVLKNVRTVAAYASFGNEVDTTRLLTVLQERGFWVVLPVVNRSTRTMEFRRMETLSSLQPGVYGIREPLQGQLCPLEQIDLFFVPGLAFDLQGRRLGRGAGYYDRYLARSVAVKIGLAYELQVTPCLPAEAHDISMDLVITEERIITFV
ncbi:MAG: 5-formyltetrahydrofolate cyclo-ligase [Firmicutes bacterium]|nr:5-formyltetrahydrofolate cyclo-ligase [Bacillota bacterium]